MLSTDSSLNYVYVLNILRKKRYIRSVFWSFHEVSEMFIIFSFILIGPAVSWKKKKKKKKENSEANSVPVKLERFINREYHFELME